jgi:hypothetical protein
MAAEVPDAGCYDQQDGCCHAEGGPGEPDDDGLFLLRRVHLLPDLVPELFSRFFGVEFLAVIADELF